MVHIESRIEINATPERVWRALCDSREVVLWDPGVIEALDAPADYPRPGQTVRWRYRSGRFRMLVDRPQVVVPERVLRSLLTLGPFRFDETYTLEPAPSGCLLAVEVDASAVLPLIGGILERYYLRHATKRDFDAALASIKRYCESSERA